MIEEAKMAGSYVKWQITRLCESQNESSVRAELAKLRRGIGKSPGSMPELWDMTLAQLPEALSGKGHLTRRMGCGGTLTLYALHQQGKTLKRNVCTKTVCFGQPQVLLTAMIMIRIKRRFDAAATWTALMNSSTTCAASVQPKSKTKLDYSNC